MHYLNSNNLYYQYIIAKKQDKIDPPCKTEIQNILYVVNTIYIYSCKALQIDKKTHRPKIVE